MDTKSIIEFENHIGQQDLKGFDQDQAEGYAKRFYYAVRSGRIFQLYLLADEIYTAWEQLKNPRPLLPLNETPIAGSNLEIRIINILDKAGITYWGDLKTHTRDSLLTIKNLGETSINQIIRELKYEINKRQGT